MTKNPFIVRPELEALVNRTLAEWKDEYHIGCQPERYGWQEPLPTFPESQEYAILDTETDGLYGTFLVCGLKYKGEHLSFYNPDKLRAWLMASYPLGCRLVMHNAAYDLTVLRMVGIYIPPSQVVDTMVAAHWRCNTSSSSLDALSGTKMKLIDKARDLGFSAPTVSQERSDVYGWVGRNHPQLLLEYLFQDLDSTEQILFELADEGATQNPYVRMHWLYASKLADARFRGIRVDPTVRDQRAAVQQTEDELLLKLRVQLGTVSHTVEKRGSKVAGIPQCRLEWKALSGKNKQEFVQRHGVSFPLTAKGNPKTDSDAVKEMLLREDLPAPVLDFLNLVKDYERVQKMGAMLDNLTTEDGRVYPSFRYVDTGRLSCSKPNLQQIPRPDENKPGGLMRRLLIPDEGNVMVVGDEGSFQIRIFAAFCEYAFGERKLTDYFVRLDKGEETTDMHTFLGRIYGLLTEDMDSNSREFKASRTVSKNCTFGRMFGAELETITKTAYKANRSIPYHVLKDQIKRALKNFDKEVPREQLTKLADKFIGKGNPTYDWLGRKYSWRDIIRQGKLYTKKIVYHIQGFEASLMVMFQIQAQRVEYQYWGHWLFPVHDEVVYEFPENLSDEACEELSKIYTQDVFMLESGMKTTAEFKPCKNWMEAK